MKKFCVFCVVVLAGAFGLVGLASAENEALYDASTGQLNIPKVVVGPNTYEVDMQLKAGEGLMTFTLSGATIINRSGNDSIVGSWVNGSGRDAVVVTFLDESNYMLAHGGDSDAAGQNGVEGGTYFWDTNTGGFSVNVTLDTTGEWGFSHPYGQVTVSVNGDILSYAVVGEGYETLFKKAH